MVHQKLIRLQEVDSTNNYARELIRSGRGVEGTAVLAYSQNSGRGQGNNVWESQPGRNLTVSYILQPFFLRAEKQFYISMVSALAAIEFLMRYTSEAKIKWPNDLYWKDRKAGGILIENTFLGNAFEFCIAGFGININQDAFLSDAPNPVSIKQITGLEFDIDKCQEELSESLYSWYGELKGSKPELVKNTYLQNLYRKDEVACYRCGSEVFSGQIIDVEDSGRLKIIDAGGKLRSFYMKEVDFII